MHAFTSESVWVNLTCLQTKLLIMWQVGTGNLVVLVKTFNCSEISMTISGTNITVKNSPSVHVLGDFNFRDIDWPDRLNKSASALSQSEGQMLIDIMNDPGLEHLVHFPVREKNTLDVLLTSLPRQFQDIHSPDKLSDHDTVAGTLKVVIPPIKKHRRKVYLYQKGDFGPMRKGAFKFAKENYFNGYPDTRSVQENFNLITSFIQDSADKHIPSKTSRTVSWVPWITSEIRRKIRRRNKTHAKSKKTDIRNSDQNWKLWEETLRMTLGSSMICM